ncbi:MAG: hypothetical protein C4523_02645 [Myxococcales bacterium]|nr:MAG: hypothetical protein C4523_02645 [Myxococcales bacterium]
MIDEPGALSPVTQTALSPIPTEQPQSLLPAIIALAKDASVDVAKLDALLRMQAEMEDRQARREFTEAFSRLSAKLPRVKKNGTIDLGKGRAIPFAKWEDMDAVIRPVYSAEGFSLTFNSAAKEGGGLVVTGELLHSSGHSKRAEIPLPVDTGPGRNNLQAVGSTLSYGKRYCAEMLLNIVREGDDDDGVKGGVSFVTPEQVAELEALIDETGTDEQKFLAATGAAHLAEIPHGAFTMAKNLLLTKLRKVPA